MRCFFYGPKWRSDFFESFKVNSFLNLNYEVFVLKMVDGEPCAGQLRRGVTIPEEFRSLDVGLVDEECTFFFPAYSYSQLTKLLKKLRYYGAKVIIYQNKYNILDDIKKIKEFGWLKKILYKSFLYRVFAKMANKKEYHLDLMMASTQYVVPFMFSGLNEEKILLNHCDDYNDVLDTRKKMYASNNKKIVVFCEQHIIEAYNSHTNLQLSSAESNQYFEYISYILTLIKERLNCTEIVIAGHPVFNKNIVERRKLWHPLKYTNKRTHELIKISDCVVTHFSTSINWAVVYNKRVVVLSKCFDWELPHWNEFSSGLASALGGRTWSLASIEEVSYKKFENTIQIDEKKRIVYMNRYICSEDDTNEMNYLHGLNYVNEEK